MPRPEEIVDERSHGHGSDVVVELKSFLQGQLDSFRNDMKRANEDAITRAIKRLRGEQRTKHVFKSKGNEEQYENQEKN